MKEYSLKQRLIKNSFWSLSISLINKIGSLIFAVILARFLMPENFGIYSIALSIAVLVSTFADLGINSALVRFISYSLYKEKRKISAYYRYLLKIKFILAIVTSVFLLIAAYPLSFYVFKNANLFLPLLISSFYIFISAFDSFYVQIFYSIEKVGYASTREAISQIMRIIIALILFFLFSSEYYVSSIFVSLTITSIIMLVFSLYYSKKLLPALYKKTNEKIDKMRVNRFIFFLTIASISAVLFSNIDSILLGLFVSPEYVGYYRAAFIFVAGLSSLILFPNIILLPILSKIGKLDKQRVTHQIIKYISIIAIPATFGIIVLGKYFIKILYGSSYLPASFLLYILSFLIFPIIITGILLPLFSSEEKTNIFANLIFFTSIINITLNIILIKALLPYSDFHATMGAAIAVLISWFYYFFATLYYVKKELHFSINFASSIRPLLASIAMFILLQIIAFYISDMSLILGIFLVILGVLVYLFFLFMFGGIKKKELEILKEIFKM